MGTVVRFETIQFNDLNALKNTKLLQSLGREGKLLTGVNELRRRNRTEFKQHEVQEEIDYKVKGSFAGN